MKIKSIIIWLYLFLSVIPLTLLGISNTIVYNDKMEQLLINDLGVAVSTQVQSIENFYHERQKDSEVVMKNMLVQDYMKAYREADAEKKEELGKYVNDLLGYYTESSDYLESFTLIDGNFQILACSMPEVVGNKSKLENIGEAYLNDKLIFTHVMQVNEPRDRKSVIALQQISENGEILGYLVQELNLDFFDEVRNSARLYNNGTIYIVSDNGLISAGDSMESRDSFVLGMDKVPDFARAWGERDLNSKDGVLEYTAIGDRYLSAYSFIDNLDWKIISSINMDAVLQTRESYMTLIFLLILVFVFVLLIANLFIHFSVGKPIQDMIGTFSVIREKQDYGLRMKVTPNEIGVISKEINGLLSNVEHYVTNEKREQERLKEKAEMDLMTGVYNKATMNAIFQEEIRKAKITSEYIAVLFLDVDDFREYNTTYGHMEADKLLCFIARTLKKYAKGMAGRHGGDEFAACIRYFSGKEELEQIIHNLWTDLISGVALEEGTEKISVSCSIGVAYSNSREMTYESLMECADQTMYQIKASGKNGYLINFVSD